MEVASPILWWIAAGLAIAAELATGTLYLLMIAAGLVAAAICAHLGLGASVQLLAAAVVGGGATALWHARRSGQDKATEPARSNRDVNLDVGERVKVAHWSADGTARVEYRGSTWVARLHSGAAALPGEHRVAAVEGNWLVLEPAAH